MQQLDLNRIPEHIAIIMDGNGRWAKAQGLPRSAGHVRGVETVRRITEEAVHLGVKFLTLYTFSTENWNRPAQEIETLMDLVLTNLEDEIFMKNNVSFRMIGQRERLPLSVQRRLAECEERTAVNTGMTMVVALSYSSRWEMTEAARVIAGKVRDGVLRVEDIDEGVMAEHLATSFMPDPDLLIRTSGELRLSNYLLWQCAYSEFYFTDTLWPDFDEAALREAIAVYQLRQRRYGKTGEQITDEMPQYEITDLPEGYIEDESKRIEWPEYISFTFYNPNKENDQRIIFDYAYMSQGGASDFVTEDSEVLSVTVNGLEGQLFLEKDWENTRSTLTWIDAERNLQFTLMAALNEIDILHIAESVSLVEMIK